MPRPKSRTRRIKVADIDRELLPPQARTPGSAAFHCELSGVVRKHMRPLGGTIGAIAWTPAELTVTWQPPAEAVEHLRRATELKPGDGGAWYGLGQALEATNDVAGADAA